MRKFPRSTWVKLGSSGALVYLVYRVGQHILQQSQLATQKREVVSKRQLEVFQAKQAVLLFTFPTPKLRKTGDPLPALPPAPAPNPDSKLDSIEES